MGEIWSCSQVRIKQRNWETGKLTDGWELNQSVMVKQGQKAKLPVYLPIYVPTLTNGIWSIGNFGT